MQQRVLAHDLLESKMIIASFYKFGLWLDESNLQVKCQFLDQCKCLCCFSLGCGENGAMQDFPAHQKNSPQMVVSVSTRNIDGNAEEASNFHRIQQILFLAVGLNLSVPH